MACQIPPLNFGMVEEEVYRCGMPNQLNFPFLEKLRLRCVICMLPDDLPRHFATWLDDQGTRCVHLGESMQMRSPWKPVPEDVILEGLSILLDPSNYPLAVMCSLGRHQTGTLIGCLRKLQGWNLASIIDEYRRYAGSKHRQLNEQFIELFDIDLVDIPLNPPRFLHIPNAAAAAGGNELGRSAGDGVR
jgi:tyrosine-protein phosphatase OCA1